MSALAVPFGIKLRQEIAHEGLAPGGDIARGLGAKQLAQQEQLFIKVIDRRAADIVVAAVGRARTIGADAVREGQVIIDVGINWDEAAGKLVGDVDFDAAEPVVGAITPVPGGVGAVTTAILARHVIEAAERASK